MFPAALWVCCWVVVPSCVVGGCRWGCGCIFVMVWVDVNVHGYAMECPCVVGVRSGYFVRQVWYSDVVPYYIV